MSGPGQLLAWACGEGIWERRMREIRTSGVTRGERVDRPGMRLVRPERGNPDTELCRSLNAVYQLPYSTGPDVRVGKANQPYALIPASGRPLLRRR